MKTRFKPKYNIKKGDQVVIIAGKDKDLATPKVVLAILPDPKNPRVIVEGVAVAKRHIKPNAQSPQGSIVEREASISLSNVMLWDAKAGAPTRIRRERVEKGGYKRISKKSNSEIV
jgi:large subunit ribosomal protein L24